ncbi:MAG: porin [Sutterellaceae bacterium]|nr:porin [Sutterellaceae bacterium]
MKKSLIALVCALATGAVYAADVEVYGAVDAYLAVNNDDGNVSSALSSGGSTGNYFGFQGSEDLWDGTQAVFKLEAGFLVDDGTFAQSYAGNTDRLFHREAWVGLRSADFGQISFGRQYTPHFLTWAMTDANGLSLGTAAGAFFYPSAAATMGGDDPTLDDLVRRNNSVFYASPNLAGFTLMAYGALGEHTKADGTQSNSQGNVYNLALNYANGPLFVMGSVLYQDLAQPSENRKDQTADHAVYYELAGIYDFGFTKAAVQLEYKDGNGTAESPDIFVGQIGATTPCFGGRINTTLAYLHDYDKADADAYSFGIRYDYDFSKQTMAYVGFVALINEDKSGRSIEAGPDSSNHFAVEALGNDQQQFFVGLRHRF